MEYHQLKAKAELASRMFKRGAASRQAEIDELKNRIDEALKCTEKCTWNLALDELKEILKGEQNE